MDSTARNNEERQARQTLVESLVSLGTRAFDPDASDGQAVAASRQQFSELVQGVQPVSLLPALNVLIQPGHVPEWLRAELTSTLALLPLRAGGVRATLEFVFSVHPAGGSANAAAAAAAPQTEGASITHEALKMATRLLASPPARATASSWFEGIAPQLMSLLDGHDGLELAKVASYVIGFGILGRKSFGAPGAPGWKHFAEPILAAIDPTTSSSRSSSRGGDAVVDLRRDAVTVLVPQQEVSRGLRRLQTLIISHPNPGLTRRLLGPLVLPLWALSSWPQGVRQIEDEYSLPARNLLRIYLRISFSGEKVLPMIQSLLFDGPRDPTKKPQWIYQVAQSGDGICIVTAPIDQPDVAEVLQSRLHEIEPKCDALLNMLVAISTDDDAISTVFLTLFARRMSAKKQKQGPRAAADVVLIKQEDEDEKEVVADDPLAELLESSVLQRVMERFPEKLARRPQDIVKLVEGMLVQLDEADDSTAVALSLLNLVVTAPGFRKAQIAAATVQSIEASLERISTHSGTGTGAVAETAATAKNLLLFLRYRDEMEEPDATAPTTDADRRRTEDRKTYSLAISYITQADAPPPVRSEGLSLLQGLITANSAVLDVAALLVLLSSLLDESEDYVNLRVVRMFAQVADRHPRATTRELLDHYVDAGETRRVDTRLRFGEALLQVIQRLGETFAGETAQQVGQTLLETAGRRGRRPKTAAKQAREERQREMRGRKVEADEEGSDEDENERENENDRKTNEILSRIVDGWGSRRGSEDVRIRASALSILATAVETNVAGLGASLTSAAVDLCLHVLAIEPEPEKAILRRAAIVLVLSFVRALHDAREAHRRLGFGLTQASQDDILRILRYVAATDEDGLVRQHAADVIESLQNWQLGSLVPMAGDDGAGPGLGRLAGLSLHPSLDTGRSTDDSTGTEALRKRPRIEEVE
ncbi:protein required for cell viability [Grosmannia clavigera kw1407]|uniref:Protein required for cell viability n=1 Tax=Grosmannia clavigera (strain kw1407 / UAMH 11150) TaxID=655863 RepID=F0X7K6_GROCL|nr:protein required for cell viability [Grosmannia clavigera kw1407]EFX06563.1 protein required for cell viability [Grosmannia clavigera kw1407]